MDNSLSTSLFVVTFTGFTVVSLLLWGVIATINELRRSRIERDDEDGSLGSIVASIDKARQQIVENLNHDSTGSFANQLAEKIGSVLKKLEEIEHTLEDYRQENRK